MDAYLETKKLDLDQARHDALIPALTACAKSFGPDMGRIYAETAEQVSRDLPLGKTRLTAAQAGIAKHALEASAQTVPAVKDMLMQLTCTRKEYRDYLAAQA